MVSLGEIVVIAQGMLDRFGADAPKMLARQIAGHFRDGDAETAQFWRRVLRAMTELEASKPAAAGPDQISRPIATAVSAMRLEKPHSLSYQVMTDKKVLSITLV